MKITLPSINNLNTDHLLLYQFLFACKPISGKLFARRSSFPTHTLAGFSANGVLKRMLSMILCSESVFIHSCACAYVFVCVYVCFFTYLFVYQFTATVFCAINKRHATYSFSNKLPTTCHRLKPALTHTHWHTHMCTLRLFANMPMLRFSIKIFIFEACQ